MLLLHGKAPSRRDSLAGVTSVDATSSPVQPVQLAAFIVETPIDHNRQI